MKEMTDDEITDKHKRVRGTHELKYPAKEGRCQKSCGHPHYEVRTTKGVRWIEHPCFLAVDHNGECEFSSECYLETSPVAVVTDVAA